MRGGGVLSGGHVNSIGGHWRSNQAGVCEGRIDELTRNNARLASDLHAERCG